MEEIKTCPACGSDALEKKNSCKDYTVSHETFEIKRCNSCELGITTPRPEKESIDKYYISENYISHSAKAKTIIDKLYLIARKFTLKGKLNLINSLQNKRGKLLDYGCGTGQFLLTCKNAGWDVEGIEPSEAARKKAKETLLVNVTDSLKEITVKYNVITLWHVLEHVPNPVEILKELSKCLTNDGIILVAVPNYKSFDGDHYKDYWAGFDVPRHFWHFTPGSLRALLKKSSLNLVKILPMKLDSFYISLLSEKYKRNKQNLVGTAQALFIGLVSNLKARKSKNYSSLIYIIKK